MKMRLAKLVVNKSGSGSSIFRATLPTKWIRSMGLDEEIRDIKLELINNKIIISKDLKERDEKENEKWDMERYKWL